MMQQSVRLPIAVFAAGLLLGSLFFTPKADAAQPHHEFKGKKKKIEVIGRVFRPEKGRVVAEITPQPWKEGYKIDKLRLVSPSGKKIRSKEIVQFPAPQTQAKRKRYLAKGGSV